MGSTKAKRGKRVASFDVYKEGRVRVFKPVNKRAKAYAKSELEWGLMAVTPKAIAAEVKFTKKLNKQGKLSLAQVRAIKALGKHRVVVYDTPQSLHFTAVKV